MISLGLREPVEVAGEAVSATVMLILRAFKATFPQVSKVQTVASTHFIVNLTLFCMACPFPVTSKLRAAENTAFSSEPGQGVQGEWNGCSSLTYRIHIMRRPGKPLPHRLASATSTFHLFLILLPAFKPNLSQSLPVF